MRTVSSCYMKYMRKAFKQTCDMSPDLEFLRDNNIMPVESPMFLRRLRFWVRLVAHAPPPLRALLAIERHNQKRGTSFACAIIEDLTFVFQRSGKFEELGSPSDCPNCWYEFVKKFPSHFFAVCREVSLLVSPSVLLSVESEDPNIQCEQCARWFSSVALPKHMFKMNGVKSRIGYHVDGVSCKICLKLFWTRTRLLHHLSQRSSKCREAYYVIDHCMSCSERDALDKLESERLKVQKQKGFLRLYAEQPVVRLYGCLRAMDG